MKKLPVEKDSDLPAEEVESLVNARPTAINMNGEKNNVYGYVENLNNNININVSAPVKHKHRMLVIIIALVAVPFAVFLGVFGYRQWKYKTLTNEATSLYEQGKYLDAIPIYEKAELYANTTDDRLYALQTAAGAYFQDYESVSHDRKSLDAAIDSHSDIIKNPEFKSSPQYYRVVAGLSHCYRTAEYTPFDEKWKNAIKILEDWLESNPPVDEVPIEVTASVYSALAEYYEGLISFSNTYLANKEITEKLMSYSEKAFQQSKLYAETKGTSQDDLLVQSQASLINTMIPYGYNSGKGLEFIGDSIKMCEELLKEIEAGTYTIDMANTVYVKYILGKAYVHYIMISKGDEKEYREKAYNILSPLLTVDKDLFVEGIVNLGYYCAQTGLCTESDISRVIDNFRVELNDPNFKKYPDDYAYAASTVLATCTYITETYPYHEKAELYGKELSEQLMDMKGYFRQADIDELSKYYDFFHGKDVKLNFVEGMISQTALAEVVTTPQP